MMNVVRDSKNFLKNFKNFQRNQTLYLQRLSVNYGVGFRNHEKSFRDRSSGCALSVLKKYDMVYSEQ